MRVPDRSTLPTGLSTTSARRHDETRQDAALPNGDFAGILSSAVSDRTATHQPSVKVQQYDIRRITYAEMAELGRALVDSGMLPESKLLDFVPLRPGAIRVDGGPAAFGPDVPIDMIQRQRDVIASQVSAGVELRFIDHSKSVLKLYEDLFAAGPGDPER